MSEEKKPKWNYNDLALFMYESFGWAVRDTCLSEWESYQVLSVKVNRVIEMVIAMEMGEYTGLEDFTTMEEQEHRDEIYQKDQKIDKLENQIKRLKNKKPIKGTNP